MIEITNFENNPKLKVLLIDYMNRIYENEAIYDDDYLLKEYNYLKNNNELDLLFIEENINNCEKWNKR